MNSIVIVGSSGHSSVVIDIIEKMKQFKIVGLLDPFKEVGEKSNGYIVLGKEEDIPLLISKHNLFGGIVAIGDNWIRAKVVDKVLNNFPDFNFIKAIHPSASLSGNVSVGIGSVVMGGAVINSNTTIGEHCIVNTNSSIDHDCKMEVFSSLAPGVTTGGNVYIGEYSAISLGAKIIHNVVIGKHTVVGAGSTVLKNLPDNCVAYNTPAKIVRNRIAGEKYL